MKTNEDFEQLLDQYNPLIHRVMKSLYIYPSDNQYEDYLQELRIKLIKIAENFDGDPLVKDKYRFTNFAKRGLTWYLINLFRSDKKAKDEVSLLDITFIEEDGLGLLEDSRLAVISFYEEVKKRLNSTEITLFWALLSGNYTSQQLAMEYGVSRKTISKRKKQIRDKLQSLKIILNQ